MKTVISTQKHIPFVILRHGQTPSNKTKVWSGWADSPLSPEGKQQAILCGQVLREYGFAYDYVYCSMLSRSIETAHRIMEETNRLWVPLIKHWQLN